MREKHQDKTEAKVSTSQVDCSEVKKQPEDVARETEGKDPPQKKTKNKTKKLHATFSLAGIQKERKH